MMLVSAFLAAALAQQVPTSEFLETTSGNGSSVDSRGDVEWDTVTELGYDCLSVFEEAGVSYTTCTTVNSNVEGRAWCRTTKNVYGRANNWDYCVAKNDTPGQRICGNGKWWSSYYKCKEGQGDCDSDSHCEGDLKCGNRNCELLRKTLFGEDYFDTLRKGYTTRYTSSSHLKKNDKCCYEPLKECNNKCQNSGTCDSSTGKAICDCRSTGYTGDTCNEARVEEQPEAKYDPEATRAAATLNEYVEFKTTTFQNYTSIFTSNEPEEIEGEHDLCAGGICSNGLRVYADKDDTTVCSNAGVLGIKGMDVNCISHAVYPGVAAFFRVLGQSKAPDGEGETKFTQISARPVWSLNGNREKDIGEDPDTFSGTELDGQLHSAGWGGSKLEGAEAAAQELTKGSKGETSTGWTKVGKTKVYNFLDAEAKAERENPTTYKRGAAVWVGDDGQGDAYAGRAFQRYARVSFIHKVNPTNDSLRGYAIDLEKDSTGLVYFFTYPEAAKHAYTLNLISREQYHEVLQATINSLLGEACCKQTACNVTPGVNEGDGTCADGSSEIVSYSGIGMPTDPCKDIRDAVQFADKEGLEYTCKAAAHLSCEDLQEKNSECLSSYPIAWTEAHTQFEIGAACSDWKQKSYCFKTNRESYQDTKQAMLNCCAKSCGYCEPVDPPTPSQD